MSAIVLSLSFALPAAAYDDHQSRAKGDPVVNVQILAFDDFHGYLESSPPAMVGTTPAGGVEYLATHLAMLRKGHKNSITAAAGDIIGGTPFLSGIFHDEPTIESMNALGLQVSSVGNHEFDQGVTELLRMQNGGCHPVDGCYFPDQPYAGADFQYLAANVVKEGTNKTVLPPYWIKKINGVKIGFIGIVLKETPALVAQAGIKGWQFKDEVATANKLVPELRHAGAEAIVLLLHEGGLQASTGTYNGCDGISGPIVDIQSKLDPAIDLIVSGHVHQAYNCVMTDPAGHPRHVTSADSYGRIITEINLPISLKTKDVERSKVTAVNHIVDQTVPKDPVQTAILTKWKAISDTVGNRPIGKITATIARAGAGGADRGSESDLGNMIADSQLWATLGNGAQLALMNPGGLRADLTYPSSAAGEGDGVVTYAESYNVQPYGNLLSTMPMSGAQIKAALEQQCQPSSMSRPFLHLGVSAGVTYDLQKTIVGGVCTSVTISNLKLNGVTIADATSYMVTVNNFLADGGDNFPAFALTPVSSRIGGGIDLDATNAYLGSPLAPIAPPGTARVNELP